MKRASLNLKRAVFNQIAFFHSQPVRSCVSLTTLSDLHLKFFRVVGCSGVWPLPTLFGLTYQNFEKVAISLYSVFSVREEPGKNLFKQFFLKGVSLHFSFRYTF